MKTKIAVVGILAGLAAWIGLVGVTGQTVNQGRTYTGTLNVQYANEGVTGTTVNKLAKLTGAPSTAIIVATTDTEGIVGVVVAGAGTTGNAVIAFKGKALCVFDSATTAGHYVVNDTSTAGDCMDSGAATYPTSGQVIGVVTSTNGGAGTYEVDLTLGQPQAGGGGSGGGGESVIAIGALPGTCTDGTAFSFTDSLYRVVCDPANTFNYFYSTYPVVPPPSAGWSWDNIASSTIDSTNGYEYLSTPKSGTVTMTARYRSAPAKPYTVKFLLKHDLSGAPPGASGTTTNSGYMVGFRDAAGKFVNIRIYTDGNGPGLTTDKWTNSTTFSAGYTNYQSSGLNTFSAVDLWSRQDVWLAISNTNTNLLEFYWSIDGLHWKKYDSRSDTDFFASAPTDYSFAAYANGNAVELAVISLKETASGTP